MPNQNCERILNEVNRVLKNSGQSNFILYSSPLQMVIETYILLYEINLLPKTVKGLNKCDIISEKYRLEGNKAFMQKNDILALKNYIKAVAFATTDGKELALAYANRSAVNFSLEEYDYSLCDIDRALSGCYPEELKYKLLERKGKCLMALNKEKEASNMFALALDFLPKSDLDLNRMKVVEKYLKTSLDKCKIAEPQVTINNDNFSLPALTHPPSDSIQVASNAVQVFFSSEMGRHVTATTDINPGDVIAVEKPYASVLLPNMYNFFCFMCKKRCHSLLPCLHCTKVLFCSEKCRDEGWEQSHCIDCSLLPTLLSIGCENMELLAVKILLLASKAGKRLLGLLTDQKYLELFDNPREKGFINGKYLSDDYKSTHNLEMNFQAHEFGDIFRKCIMAVLILHALEECTNFFKHSETEYTKSKEYLRYRMNVPNGKGMSLAKASVGALLLRYLLSVPCNAHEVSEMQLMLQGKEFVSESVEIGGAVYPFLSLINHSCDPNVVRFNYQGDVVVLIAIKVIKPGEQIFDNYSYHYAMHTKEQRQTHLLSQYYFQCKCDACLNDWPLYANLPEESPCYFENVNEEEIQKSSIKFKKFLTKISEGDVSDKLPFLCNHLRLLHKSIARPWKEYNQCQEAIKQCLSVQANHYVYKSNLYSFASLIRFMHN